MITILVTGTGAGIAISIMKAARRAGYAVVAVDMNPISVGLLRGDKNYVVPAAHASNYIPVLMEICNKEDVDALIPGSDVEVMVLALNKERIQGETDATVIVGNIGATAICKSKLKTQTFLKQHGFNFCKSCLKEQAQKLADIAGFPLIVKPEYGAGSVNLFKANNMDEVQLYTEIIERHGDVAIVQEYLYPEDEEYTTGVMLTRGGELLGSITLKRMLKKGDTYKAWSGEYSEVRYEMEKIAMGLDTVGPLNLQCRFTERGPVVFEINPRFSGTTAVRASFGFNDVEMVVENFLHGTIPTTTDYRKDMVMIRYLNEVYISKENLESGKKGYLEKYF